MPTSCSEAQRGPMARAKPGNGGLGEAENIDALWVSEGNAVDILRNPVVCARALVGTGV